MRALQKKVASQRTIAAPSSHILHQMRVQNSLRLVRGARRVAAYDMDAGTCQGVSEDEASLLEHLAKGFALTSWRSVTNAPSSLIASQLREKRLTRPGRPSSVDISFPDVRQQNKPEQLEHVWFEVTLSCNLECSHCYAESGPHIDRGDELADEQWGDVATKIATSSPKIVTMIGGEPTIRLDAVERVCRIFSERSPNTKLRIFSSLSIPRTIDRLIGICKEYGLEIGTSLYGIDSRTHDEATTKNGSWTNTTKAIRALTAANISVFAGYYGRQSDLPDIEVARAWLSSLGLSDFELLTPAQIGRGQKIVWRNAKTINTLPKIKYFTENTLSDLEHNCFKDHLSIRANGSVNPCIMTRNVNLGNLLLQPLQEVLNGDAFQAHAALGKSKIEGCSECEFRFACFDCRPDASAGTGNLLAKPKCGYDPRELLGGKISE